MTRSIVVMGVCGCGKTTLAIGIAARLGWAFIEGDDCHPSSNIAKMASGVPLTDADRLPFLQTVGDRLAQNRAGAVASCSALKRSYRDIIRERAGDVLFVLPILSGDRLVERVRRPDHFMPPSLLSSQLALLEAPDADERALVVDGVWPTNAQVDAVCSALTRRLPHQLAEKDCHGLHDRTRAIG